LTVAADQLVIGSGRLAHRLRIAPVVIGVAVIGLGTSAPEFLVSGLAAARGDLGIATGNLIGSNILNITLILGIAALISPVIVRSSVIRREAPISVGATVLLAGAAWWGPGRLTGAVLGLLGIAALVVLVRLARHEAGGELPDEVIDFLDEQPRHSAGRETVRTAVGLAGTLAGAQLLVVNAAELAARFDVPQSIIGFTLVALGTSLPELVTSIQAQRRGESDLLVGNLLGSNLFNSLFGGAIVGLAAPGGGRGGVGLPIVGAMVFVSLLAWVVLFRGLRVSRPEAFVLLLAYLCTLPLMI
jgi:cation:H+ antiporter